MTSSFAQNPDQKNNAEIRKLFSAASSIKLLSFTSRNEYPEASAGVVKDTAYFVAKELRILKSTIKDNLMLSAKQRDALLRLLLPPIPWGKGKHDVVFCYDPRHAIIFYDARAQPIAYIELCLECGNYEMSPKLFLEIYFSNRAAYRNLFQSFGVKYLGPQ
jgi:hypothetical protein